MKRIIAIVLIITMALWACACGSNTGAQIQSYPESSTLDQTAISSEPIVNSESPDEQVQTYCNIKNSGDSEGEVKVPYKVYEVFADSSIIAILEASQVKYFPNKSKPAQAADCSFSLGKYDFVAKGFVSRKSAGKISVSDDSDPAVSDYTYTLNSIQSADGKKIYWAALGLEDKENADFETDCPDLIPKATLLK